MSKVSVIIPFLNRVSWTVDAVMSVLAQSFLSFEVLLINDGSTESVEPLELIQDERIKIFSQNNQGQSSARNLGIKESSGDYIAFLDSDDLWFKDKLRIQVGIMEAHPEIAISHTSYEKIDINGKHIETIDSGRFSGRVYPEIFVNCPIATPTVMVRKESIGEMNFIDKVLIGEDIIFWSKLCKDSDIIGISQPLTKVRIHGENAANNPNSKIAGLENIMKFGVIPDKTIPKTKKKELLGIILLNIGGIYWKIKKIHKSILYISRALVVAPFNNMILRKLLGILKSYLISDN